MQSMPNEPANTTFSDLMAKTGYFVLYWSSFELSLGEAIEKMTTQLGVEAESARGGLKERLALWEELINRLSDSASTTGSSP